MNYFSRDELDDAADRRLRRYDEAVRAIAGPEYAWPLRMRDWELLRVLDAAASLPRTARILEIGAYNTYLSAYLARNYAHVTASDRLAHRRRKSLLRRLGLAARKPTEAPFSAWRRTLRSAGVALRDFDATRLPCPEASFDCVIALSVLEHIPAIESALAELYRVLAPDGKLLITIDAAPAPVPYADGVRYFAPAELDRLFAPYPVTSPRNTPDFSPPNWCYGGKRPVLAAFVEVTKPAGAGRPAASAADVPAAGARCRQAPH